MRIKVATLSLALVDLVLFVACGFVVASRPPRSAPRHDQIQFVIRSYSIFVMLLVCLLITIILVWVWMQRLREELRSHSDENLRELIEGTLRDHEQKTS
jgi:protein-S-isoprenylcysteine O-methyltransferase Ste14